MQGTFERDWRRWSSVLDEAYLVVNPDQTVGSQGHEFAVETFMRDVVQFDDSWLGSIWLPSSWLSPLTRRAESASVLAVKLAGLTIASVLLVLGGCLACAPPDPPPVEGPRAAVLSIAEEPPFVGEEGLDPYGYPWRLPDKLKLLNLLRLRRFEELDRFFAFYQAEFEKDFRKEYWPDRALSAFYIADGGLEPLFDEWIERQPGSFAAYAARGNYRYKVGWYFRGTEWASETSLQEFRSMGQYMDLAAQDLTRAVELRPRFVAAYRRLSGILNATSATVRDQNAVLLAALKQCRACFLVRAQHIESLRPRWGGSYAAMESFAAGVRSLLADNPRLRLLEGQADRDRCVTLRERERYDEAHEACDRALEFGDSVDFLVAKSRVLGEEGRHEEALVVLDRALRMAPQEGSVRKRRFWSLRKLGHDWIAAGENILLARQLDPTNKWVSGHVDYMIDKLRYEGDVLSKAGEYAAAADFFTLGLRLAPDDKDLMHRQAWNQKQLGTTRDDVQLQLDASPDDYELRLRIDHGWAANQRFDLVVIMWDEYIARHPSDPRPFRERAGAKWHLRRLDEAIADMAKACDLGMDTACADVAAMKARKAD